MKSDAKMWKPENSLKNVLCNGPKLFFLIFWTLLRNYFLFLWLWHLDVVPSLIWRLSLSCPNRCCIESCFPLICLESFAWKISDSFERKFFVRPIVLTWSLLHELIQSQQLLLGLPWQKLQCMQGWKKINLFN